MIKGKHILVGVTGGIAAYKTATIIRLLVKEGAVIKVLMTDHAKEFITPLTLATLSKNPVLTAFIILRMVTGTVMWTLDYGPICS
jgi:phosphopantothenoylcysteine decarboxylase/phosphopantothenate--cysteine ligase